MRAAAALLLALSVGLAGPAYAERSDQVAAAAARPLDGRVVVLDPGHQLGNHRFPRQINRLVPDGRGGRKACNTTGTATAAGVPEATVVWRVARLVEARLERLGATVRLTRTSNSSERWGPCVDARGRAGNRPRADLTLSIHGDGVLTGSTTGVRRARGFHVIVAPDGARGSLRLARTIRDALESHGIPAANYLAGGTGLDRRTDLATLNLSRIPTAMVELGNLRDRVDARRLTTTLGRADYATALTRAVRRYLRWSG